jgi:hypothetical protein
MPKDTVPVSERLDLAEALEIIEAEFADLIAEGASTDEWSEHWRKWGESLGGFLVYFTARLASDAAHRRLDHLLELLSRGADTEVVAWVDRVCPELLDVPPPEDQQAFRVSMVVGVRRELVGLTTMSDRLANQMGEGWNNLTRAEQWALVLEAEEEQ